MKSPTRWFTAPANKQDHTSPEEGARYRQEYDLTRSLPGESIIRVYGLETDGGRPVLLEEHLKLEWEYKAVRERGSESASGRAGEIERLVPPPEEEMAVLHDLALMGDMWAIRERAAHIETLGEQYAPFAIGKDQHVK